MASDIPRYCPGARLHAGPTVAPVGVEVNSYVPRAEPKGDPEGAGSPRGPPLDRRLWLVGETSREEKEAPRMAATIRDHEIQTKVNGHSVSHCVRGIKVPFTPFSRTSVGRRTASGFVRESSPPDYDAGLTRHEKPRSYRTENRRVGRSCAPAQAGTSPLRTGQHAPPGGPPSGSAAWWLGLHETIQVREAKVRPGWRLPSEVVIGAKPRALPHFSLAPIRRGGLSASCAAATRPFRAEPSRA